MLDYELARGKLSLEIPERREATNRKRLDTMNRRNYFILKRYIESDLSVAAVAEEFCVSEARVIGVATGRLPVIYPAEGSER